MRTFIRPMLIVLGTLFVALAVVGIFVPFLPTTPFLLLAAACYARSSDRFLHWLLNNRYLGEYIRNYRAGRGMPRQTKILTLATLWLTLALSAVFATTAWWPRLMLAIVGMGVTIHLLRLQTYNPENGEARSAAPNPSPLPSDDT